MSQPDKITQNLQSGPEVAQKRASDRPAPPSRFAAAYWLPRVARRDYTYDGKVHHVQEFSVRMKLGKRRERVPLGTNSQAEAARRAATFYSALVKTGWEVALREFCPGREKAGAVATVGEFVAAVETAGGLRPRTLAGYTYSLRKIAGEIAGRSLQTAKRFDPVKRPWRKAPDTVELSALTPEAITGWRVGFVARAGRDPMRQQQAKRSANSYIRNARSLFTRQVLEKVNVALPSPLPFAGVELERNVGSTRYQSTFNAADLLARAKTELADGDPDGFAVFLLALGAGLRRGEIDNLQWQQIDFAAGAIRVMPLRHFIPKTDSSEGVVFVDAMLLAELAKVRAACPAPKTLFVVEPNTDAAQTRAAQYYRAAATFARLTAWLRANGVDSSKPLHALRKEFGSILTARGDIHVASRMLRHSNLGTTAAYYVEARRSTVVPIGDMIKQATA